MDYLAGDLDTEAEAARDSLQQARDEQQLRMDEKINPRWIDSQAAGPAFLLVLAFLLWGEAAEYGAPSNAWDELLVLPFMLASIAVVWFAKVLIIDRFR